MYAADQKAKNQNNGAGVQGAQLGAVSTQAVKPSSPVDIELSRYHTLTMELEQTVNSLIPPLRAILVHDPREPRPSADKAADRAPFSCDLERLLSERNDQLNASIVMLRELNDAIRL